MIQIRESGYKDITAIEALTQKWSVKFSPEYGGKMLSLVCRETGREILEQATGQCYRKPQYAASYIDAECSAFDDMFPTIDECFGMEYPWHGTLYPDHGEVYSLPWQYEKLDDCLHMWVYSVRFSYRLDKFIYDKEGALRVAYKAHNLSPFAFSCLYAAHCMLKAEEGAVLEVPYEDGSRCTLIFSDIKQLGSYGDKIIWPAHNGWDLSRTPPKSAGVGYKIYFDQPMGESICTYAYPNGQRLRMRLKGMPYFAIWANYGAFKGMYNVAVEPCTAALDSPFIAKAHGKGSSLPGGAAYEWEMEFDMEPVDKTFRG